MTRHDDAKRPMVAAATATATTKQQQGWQPTSDQLDRHETGSSSSEPSNGRECGGDAQWTRVAAGTALGTGGFVDDGWRASEAATMKHAAPAMRGTAPTLSWACR